MTEAARRDPGWMPLAAGQTTLLLWVALLVYHDLDPSSAVTAANLAGSATGAAVVGVFGFVIPVILGMFPRLAPGLLGLPRARFSQSLPPALSGLVLSALAIAWLATGHAPLLSLLGAMGAVGALALVSTLVRLARTPRNELPVAARPRFARLKAPANLCLAAGISYLAVGASLFAVANDPGLRRATGFAATAAGPLHMVTAGFIVLSVYGIGLRMFSAFSGRDAPPLSAWAIAALGVPAPAGIAWALAGPPPNFMLVAGFGALALCAAAVFSATVFYMRANQRRPRAGWWLISVASAMLVFGQSLGVAFGANPSLLYLAPVHAQINVLGFAALMIFGVLFEFSGASAATPGHRTAGLAVAAVWPIALAVRLLGYVAAVPLAVTASSILLLAGLLAALADAHPNGRRRGRRPVPASGGEGGRPPSRDPGGQP